MPSTYFWTYSILRCPFSSSESLALRQPPRRLLMFVIPRIGEKKPSSLYLVTLSCFPVSSSATSSGSTREEKSGMLGVRSLSSSAAASSSFGILAAFGTLELPIIAVSLLFSALTVALVSILIAFSFAIASTPTLLLVVFFVIVSASLILFVSPFIVVFTSLFLLVLLLLLVALAFFLRLFPAFL